MSDLGFQIPVFKDSETITIWSCDLPRFEAEGWSQEPPKADEPAAPPPADPQPAAAPTDPGEPAEATEGDQPAPEQLEAEALADETPQAAAEPPKPAKGKKG